MLRIIAGVASVALLNAQPAFEVASIKPNTSGALNRTVHPASGRLNISNMTLKDLLMFAYQVRDFQISGGPGWIDSDHYDIETKAGGDPPNEADAANASPRRVRGGRSIMTTGSSRSMS